MVTLVPLSMVGLPVSKAIVSVGPPLSCSPLGSSFGSNGAAMVPVWSVLAIVKPAPPSLLPIRLKPPEAKDPSTSGVIPSFKAIMLLLIVADVELTLSIPPPLPWAELPDIVLLLTYTTDLLKMPPPELPEAAELPVKVLLMTVTVPPRTLMPPPLPWAELLDSVLLVTLPSPPTTLIPPPAPALPVELPVSVLLVTLTV